MQPATWRSTRGSLSLRRRVRIPRRTAGISFRRTVPGRKIKSRLSRRLVRPVGEQSVMSSDGFSPFSCSSSRVVGRSVSLACWLAGWPADLSFIGEALIGVSTSCRTFHDPFRLAHILCYTMLSIGALTILFLFVAVFVAETWAMAGAFNFNTRLASKQDEEETQQAAVQFKAAGYPRQDVGQFVSKSTNQISNLGSYSAGWLAFASEPFEIRKPRVGNERVRLSSADRSTSINVSNESVSD